MKEREKKEKKLKRNFARSENVASLLRLPNYESYGERRSDVNLMKKVAKSAKSGGTPANPANYKK